MLAAVADPSIPGRASTNPPTERPQGVLPHCPSGGAPAVLPAEQEAQRWALLAVVPPRSAEVLEMSTIMTRESLLLLPVV